MADKYAPGSTFRAPYPFVRATYAGLDEDGEECRECPECGAKAFFQWADDYGRGWMCQECGYLEADDADDA